MSSIDLQYRDTQTYQHADARSGTDGLLARLIHEHNHNMTPPEGWTPQAVRTTAWVEALASPPEPIQFPSVSKPLWFSIDDETVHQPKIGDIKRAVCRYFGVTAVDMDSARRTLNVVRPRQVAMYLARTLTGKSLPEIGRRFGGRDHTTVLHGARKIERETLSDWTVAYDVAHVEALLT